MVGADGFAEAGRVELLSRGDGPVLVPLVRDGRAEEVCAVGDALDVEPGAVGHLVVPSAAEVNRVALEGLEV